MLAHRRSMGDRNSAHGLEQHFCINALSSFGFSCAGLLRRYRSGNEVTLGLLEVAHTFRIAVSVRCAPHGGGCCRGPCDCRRRGGTHELHHAHICLLPSFCDFRTAERSQISELLVRRRRSAWLCATALSARQGRPPVSPPPPPTTMRGPWPILPISLGPPTASFVGPLPCAGKRSPSLLTSALPPSVRLIEVKPPFPASLAQRLCALMGARPPSQIVLALARMARVCRESRLCLGMLSHYRRRTWTL